MKVNVFDDVKGTIFHIIAGTLTGFLPVMFVVFVSYEYIEHIYLNGKEKEMNYLGDILEYSFGVMLVTVFYGFMKCLGILILIVFILGLYICLRRLKK